MVKGVLGLDTICPFLLVLFISKARYVVTQGRPWCTAVTKGSTWCTGHLKVVVASEQGFRLLSPQLDLARGANCSSHSFTQLPGTPNQQHKALQAAPQQQQQQQQERAALQLARSVRMACLALGQPATAWV